MMAANSVTVNEGETTQLIASSPLLVQCTNTLPSVTDVNEASVKDNANDLHIPYILNGELYEIQTQDGANVTVRCCHCPPDRVYRGSVRSTGNFHMHIKRRHPGLLGKLHEMKVSALLERRDRLIRNRKSTSRSGRRSTAPYDQPATNMSTAIVTSHSDDIKSEMHHHPLPLLQRTYQSRASTQICDAGPFVVVPLVDNKPTIETEPINYSIKKEVPRVEKSPPLIMNKKHIPIPSNIEKASEPFVMNENSLNIDNTSDCSTMDGSCINQLSGKHIHLGANSIVKNETLSDQAIDLTFSSASSGICSNTSTEWKDLMHQTKSALKGIRHELRNHNRIDNKRLFLDVAKFKYLHPEFNFQY